MYKTTEYSSKEDPCVGKTQYEPLREKRKTTIWVPTRSDTNRAIQSQKMVRGWKFCIYVEEGLYLPCSKDKGDYQLRGY